MRLLISLTIILLHTFECFSDTYQLSDNHCTDTLIGKTRLMVEYKIGQKEFENWDKEMSVPRYLIYDNQKLYMYNLNYDIICYNLDSNNTNVSVKLRNLITGLFKKSGAVGESGFFVCNDTIYVGINNKTISVIDKKKEVLIKEFNSFPEVFNKIISFKNQIIFALSTEGFTEFIYNNPVYNYTSTGWISSDIAGISGDTCFMSDCYTSYITLFGKNHKNDRVIFSFNETKDDVSPLGLTPNYYIWMEQGQKGFWKTNRYTKKKQYVKFSFNFLKQPRYYPIEDNCAGIKFAPKDDNTFYFAIMNNETIQLYEVKTDE